MKINNLRHHFFYHVKDQLFHIKAEIDNQHVENGHTDFCFATLLTFIYFRNNYYVFV